MRAKVGLISKTLLTYVGRVFQFITDGTNYGCQTIFCNL